MTSDQREEEVQRLLVAMTKADPELYERIEDTPVFCDHFKRLINLASTSDEREDA